MVRRTDLPRDARPASYQLFRDQDEKAALEARNGLLQIDQVHLLADEAIRSESRYRLRPSTIQALHRTAIKDIYTCAGNYRTLPISINNTPHQPPEWTMVSRLVEEMCDYVNENWSRSPIHLSAYLMWRINWIHPFMGGNGRISRAVSYLILCIRLGFRLPGTLSMPEQIVENRQPYYEALDAADAAWQGKTLDVSLMEDLLSSLLAKQLVSIHQQAIGKNTAGK